MSKNVLAIVMILGLIQIGLAAELAEPVSTTVPAIAISLDSWNSAYQSYYSGYGSSYNTPSTKMEGDNYYHLSTHIYYRVLVKPDGSEQVIDEYKFDNHNITSYANNYCVQSYGCSSQTYYSDHIIPEINVTLD